MPDQAFRLRKLIKAGSLLESGTTVPLARSIAITSGKGGVGKTNIVVNLAISLARRGQRVVIFDADLGMANVDVLLGLVPRYSLYDVLTGRKTLPEILVTGPCGITVIPGGSGIEDIANLDQLGRNRLIEAMRGFEDQVDFLIIDTGAGISRNVLGFLAAADEVVVVVTPEPTSITDAYGIIKVMARLKLHPRAKLLLNRVSGPREAEETAFKIQKATERFLGFFIETLGYIDDDRSVGRSVQEQSPFVLDFPNCAASLAVQRVADRVLDLETSAPRGRGHFIGRLLRLFGQGVQA